MGTEPESQPEPVAFEAVLTADVRADVEHPDRDLTPEERAHLGLPEESGE